MSDRVHRVTTEEGRERLSIARHRGGMCAACGRTLGDDEPVYIERVAFDRKPLTAPGAWWFRPTVFRDAALCAGCASPGLLARTTGRTPEPCEHCGRPMYYAKARAQRQRAMCSKRCHNRAAEGRRNR